LVILLDTGSTQLIRNTAAQQLADVQKNHPDELFNLLTRVVPFLRSSSWDTRTATAKALGGIFEHAPKFNPNEADAPFKHENGSTDVKDELNQESDSTNSFVSEDQLELTTLDVEAILTHGKELLSNAGRQYDFKLLTKRRPSPPDSDSAETTSRMSWLQNQTLPSAPVSHYHQPCQVLTRPCLGPIACLKLLSSLQVTRLPRPMP
jgi:HEAT repeat protein